MQIHASFVAILLAAKTDQAHMHARR
jgi:hypothetical protein